MSVEFDLPRGLTLGEGDSTRVLKHVRLRAPCAGDLIEAQEESEKLVYAMEGDKLVPTLVASPSLVGIQVLRRQIVSIGDVQGPLDIALIKKLCIKDLDCLQTKANELDVAIARDASHEVAQRGRLDGDSGGD